MYVRPTAAEGVGLARRTAGLKSHQITFGEEETTLLWDLGLQASVCAVNVGRQTDPSALISGLCRTKNDHPCLQLRATVMG